MSSAADVTAPTELALWADGKMLDRSPSRLGRLVPTLPDRSFGDLREQLHEQGYLWLKHFLDARIISDYRRHVFSYLAGSGLIAPGTDPGDGIASDHFDKSLADRGLMSLVRSARYEAFCMQPALVHFMDQFLEGLSYLHRRKIMRYTRPGSGAVTPAHYDLVYLRGGTTRLVTAWIPIGDIPAEMGGLTYLEGSHRLGVEMEREFTAKAAHLAPEEQISAYNKNMTEGGWVSKDLPDMAQRFNSRWLIADFEAGDVMLHSPYMVHASTSNEDARGRIRLSTDIRYQNVEDEIDVRWTNHWSLNDML
jgi:ectoine hydroxylase-related dioxygenase (phytanoyl-CoA dioxygenase family)